MTIFYQIYVKKINLKLCSIFIKHNVKIKDIITFLCLLNNQNKNIFLIIILYFINKKI